jgi:hypothetical protein
MSVEVSPSIQPYIARDNSTLKIHQTQRLRSAPTEMRVRPPGAEPDWVRAFLRSKRVAKHLFVGRRLVSVDILTNLLRVDYLGWKHNMLAVMVLAESTAPVGSSEIIWSFI